MTLRSLLALILLGSALSIHAAEPETAQRDFAQKFAAAQVAYDSGNPAEAANLYRQLIDAGIENPELQYNLGNALFKSGDLPQAVKNYRLAEYQNPRDPDIRANLQFALDAAGAVAPRLPIHRRLFAPLTQNEWTIAMITGYLLVALLLGLSLAIRPARRLLARLSLIPALLILLGLGGRWHWNLFGTQPEWVVTRSGAATLFSPFEGATVHYEIPPAALVQQTRVDAKGWIEVLYDGKSGWLKESHIQRVSP